MPGFEFSQPNSTFDISLRQYIDTVAHAIAKLRARQVTLFFPCAWSYVAFKLVVEQAMCLQRRHRRICVSTATVNRGCSGRGGSHRHPQSPTPIIAGSPIFPLQKGLPETAWENTSKRRVLDIKPCLDQRRNAKYATIGQSFSGRLRKRLFLLSWRQDRVVPHIRQTHSAGPSQGTVAL